MKEFIGKYIGSDQIKKVKISERKTYIGNDIWEVIYDVGQDEFSAEMLERITSDEPKDLTALRDLLVDPLVEKIIAILLDGEIKVVDVEYLLQKVSLTLNHHLEQANEKLWGKDLFKRTLADVQKILTYDSRTIDNGGDK